MTAAVRQVLRRIGGRVGSVVVRISGDLTRLHILHPERESNALKSNQSVIYAFWHGRLWLLASRLRDRKAGVLVSLSEDGEVIARITHHLGYRPVRGSSSRRGREGLRDLEALLGEGTSVALTPDGPRGPRHRAQLGAVVLAARTGKPVLPVTAAARRAWTLKSWDAFQVPCPGTRTVIAFGEPLHVPSAGDMEAWRGELETALNRIEAEADAAVR